MKTIWKRLAGVFLAVCVAAIAAPVVLAAGEPIDLRGVSESNLTVNEDDKTLTGKSQQQDLTVSCTAAVKSLTLSNVTTGTLTFEGSDPITLTLEGTNSLKSLSTPSASLTIKGDGTLTVDATGQSDKAVDVGGALTVSGGTLNATGGTSSTGNSYGVSSASSVTVNGGKLEATGGAVTGDKGKSYGVKAGNVTVENGTLTATGGSAANLSYGVSTGSVTVENGTLTAAGGSAANYSCGVSTGSVTVENGTLTAAGGSAANYSCGVSAGDTVTVSGGTLDATGGEATGTDGVSYGVTIHFGTRVDGNVTVNGTGTLNAKGGKANNGSSYGLYVPFVTVEGSGTLTATGGEASGSGSISYGVLATDNVTVSGGTLDATGGESTGGISYGVGTGSVTVNGGTLLAKGGDKAVDGADFIAIGDGLPSYTVSTVEGAEGGPVTGKPYAITGTKFLKLVALSAKPDETDLDSSSPSTPSTPYIPPVTVPADTASGSTSGAKLEMKASQLPSGVEASDVTFVAKAVSAPAKLASTTLESIPNLPTAKSITVYDLDLLLKSSGEKVDFTGKVTVSIPMPAGYGSFLRVFHVANDGTMTEVPAVISGSNILLTLEHFSHYAVVDFASPAGKLPTKLTASATVTTAATTAKPSEGGNNAGKNPTTGAMLPLLAIIGCAGAGMVAMKVAKKK